MQKPDSKFVVVCEGPFDAMSIDGVSVSGAEISDTQVDQIDRLQREVIVVPDRDSAGRKLVDRAIEAGWSVSFPVWQETCKDVNEAVVKHGKLFVLKCILDAKETSKLKIELKKKKL
jgi:DNA primase